MTVNFKFNRGMDWDQSPSADQWNKILAMVNKADKLTVAAPLEIVDSPTGKMIKISPISASGVIYGTLLEPLNRGSLEEPQYAQVVFYDGSGEEGFSLVSMEAEYCYDIGVTTRRIPSGTIIQMNKRGSEYFFAGPIDTFASISISSELTGDLMGSFSATFTDTGEALTCYLAEPATAILNASTLWASWSSVRQKWIAHVAPCPGGVDT